MDELQDYVVTLPVVIIRATSPGHAAQRVLAELMAGQPMLNVADPRTGDTFTISVERVAPKSNE